MPGKSWQRVSGVPTDAPINTIAVIRNVPDYIYVGTKQAFYMSKDDGVNWSRRGGNLPFGDFTSILINPRNGDEVFVGNAYQTGEIGGGVYRTVNAGTTWARIDPKERRYPANVFGPWLWTRRIKTRFSWVLIPPVFMLFRAVSIVCRPRSMISRFWKTQSAA